MTYWVIYFIYLIKFYSLSFKKFIMILYLLKYVQNNPVHENLMLIIKYWQLKNVFINFASFSSTYADPTFKIFLQISNPKTLTLFLILVPYLHVVGQQLHQPTDGSKKKSKLLVIMTRESANTCTNYVHQC